MEKRNLFVSGKAVVAAVCGAFTAAFGWLGWLVVAWAACMALDWVSGSAAAASRGAWSSAAARAGIWHKAGMVVVVLVCALTDAVLAVAAAQGSGMRELYGPTRFAAAAEAGADALEGGALTEFEKLCDDAVGDYLAGAQYVPFGEAPLVGYLAARETEYTNLRILLMGRGAGLPADVIRSRLRASYV